MADLEFAGVAFHSFGDMTQPQWAMMEMHIGVHDKKLDVEALTTVRFAIVYVEADTVQAIRERAYRRGIECVRLAVSRLEALPAPPIKKSEDDVFPKPSGPEDFGLQFRMVRFTRFEDMRTSGWANVHLKIFLHDKKLITDATISIEVPIAYDETDTTEAVRERAYRRAIECLRVALPEMESTPPPRVKKAFAYRIDIEAAVRDPEDT